MRHWVLFLLAAAILLAGCTTGSTQTTDDIDILASTYPFYDLTSQVTPSNLTTSYLVPPSVSPHHFNPTPADRQKIRTAQIYITQGVALETWEQGIIEDADLVFINASTGIELQNAAKPHSHDDGSQNDHGHSIDPHYWLAPQHAITIVETISNRLIEQYPAHEEEIQTKKTEYVQQLEQLHQQYDDRLSSCENSAILTSHAAFSYLGEAYGFTQIPLLGITATSEPSPREVQELVDRAEAENIDTVFYEASGDRQMAQTIATEIDGEIRPLHTITTIDNPSSQDYISLMEQNLAELEEALKCQ